MTETRETNILVFGASTVHGAWDPEGGGWVGRLNRFLMERIQRETDPYFTVYNLGVNGDTSSGLIRRFEQEAKARFVRAESNVIVFSIGINDSVLLDDKEHYVTPEEFRQNISSLVSLARMFGPIVFVGLTRVEESKTTPIPWQRRWYYRNNSIKAYDTILREVSTQGKIPFIDLMPIFTENYYKLLDDGLHPNAEGHQKVFEIVKMQLSNHDLI